MSHTLLLLRYVLISHRLDSSFALSFLFSYIMPLLEEREIRVLNPTRCEAMNTTRLFLLSRVPRAVNDVTFSHVHQYLYLGIRRAVAGERKGVVLGSQMAHLWPASTKVRSRMRGFDVTDGSLEASRNQGQRQKVEDLEPQIAYS